MAISMKSDENSRFTDLYGEPVDRFLSPIKDYQEKPLIPLSDAIKPISQFFSDIEDNAFLALHNCQNPPDDLTQQESASIHLYTMKFYDGASLYVQLNQSLRAENRDELKPWFSFLKLFLTGLYKLPSQNKTVWRGVRNIDLSAKYKTGTKFIWWGVSSCTTHIEVLESKEFSGKHGQRTLFSIDCINGKSVANHSYYKNTEKEIILMPGSYFKVIGQLNPAPQLHIIHLREILPPITLVEPPFYKPTDINPPSVVSKPDNKEKDLRFTVAGGNGWGNKLNQLSDPQGIFIDDDQTIYIADCHNHRIVEWKPNAKNGQIVAGENGKGNKTNQLHCPTDVIIDKKR